MSSPEQGYGSLLPPFALILMAVRMAAIAGLTWLAGRMYSNAALHLGTRVGFMKAFRG